MTRPISIEEAGALLDESAHLVGTEFACGAIEPVTHTASPAIVSLDLSGVLDATRAFVRRFVVVRDAQADAIALWVAHTYVFDTAKATPYLHFHSPEPGSGKTTALEVLAELVREPLPADDVSAASLYRIIEELTPTLLIDEVDGIVNRKGNDRSDDVLKILKSGYKRGKYALRVGGAQRDRVEKFAVYSPKALAGLNGLKDPALSSRCISIAMETALQSELRDYWDAELVEDETTDLRARYVTWANEARQAMSDRDKIPAILTELSPRANEIWRVLFRIADLAGDEWSKRAREAALTLFAAREEDDSSIGVQLLRSIHGVFEKAGRARYATRELLDFLNADDGASWGAWNKSNGMTARDLSKKLTPYKIKPDTVHLDDGSKSKASGYKREQFDVAWQRYCPDLVTDLSLPSGAGNGSTTLTDPHEKSEVSEVSEVRDSPEPGEQLDLTTAPMDAVRDEYEGASEVAR